MDGGEYFGLRRKKNIPISEGPDEEWQLCGAGVRSEAKEEAMRGFHVMFHAWLFVFSLCRVSLSGVFYEGLHAIENPRLAGIL